MLLKALVLLALLRFLNNRTSSHKKAAADGELTLWDRLKLKLKVRYEQRDKS